MFLPIGHLETIEIGERSFGRSIPENANVTTNYA